MEYEKIYVETLVRFPAEGGMRPVAVIWENGSRFEIDRIKFIDRAPARVSAVLPMRYTCVMGGRGKVSVFRRRDAALVRGKERL